MASPRRTEVEKLREELKRISFDEDIYDSVLIAAFGGINRHCHGAVSSQIVHPFFVFILCLPLFFLQCSLIVLMELDFDNTAPVLADGSRNPTALLVGKVLMAGCLQLVLFAELCQSLRLLCLAAHPGFWTDVKRQEWDGNLHFISRPLCQAPISFVAMLLKTIIAFWVTLSSLSVVLVCEDVPECIMNSLAVVFIAEMDVYWWTICKAVYEFDAFDDFHFELHAPDDRIRARRSSLFKCVLSETGTHNPLIGNIVTGVFMLCIYAWQGFVVTFAIDTNVLPVARDTCASWHLMNGHPEYRINPTFFAWVVHLFPLNISKMIAHIADPKFYGYCSEKYHVMTVADMTSSLQRHPIVAVASCLAVVCVIGFPNLWFSISEKREESSRFSILREEQGVRSFSRVRTDEIQQVREEVDQMAHVVESIHEEEVELKETDIKIKLEIKRVKDEGAREIATLRTDLHSLRAEFQREGERGEQFQSQMQDFQTNVFEIFQDDVKKLKDNVINLERHQQELQRRIGTRLAEKWLSSDGMTTQSTKSDVAVLVSHAAATSAYKGSPGLESKAEMSPSNVLDVGGLDYEELNCTQHHALLDPDGAKETKAVGIDVTMLPPSPCCVNAPDMNITRAPDCVKDQDMNLTMSPIAACLASPDVLHKTIPPVTPGAGGHASGGRSGPAFTASEQPLTPQITSFMQEIRDQMAELRQAFGMQREEKTQVSSDMEAILSDMKCLKANFASVREPLVVSHREDILSQTKLVSLPHDSQLSPSSVALVGRPIVRALTADNPDKNTALQEAAHHLSSRSCSEGTTSPQMVSARRLPQPEVRSASFNPPPLVQKNGQTVILPPRARSATTLRIASSDAQHRRYVQSPRMPELRLKSTSEASKMVARSAPVVPVPLGVSNCTGTDMPRVISQHALGSRLIFSTSTSESSRYGLAGGEVATKDLCRPESAHVSQQVQQLHYPRYS